MCLFTIFYLATTSYSQFNLGVTYTIGILQADAVDDIYSRYNASRPWLDVQLDEINLLNGYAIGVRYKIERIALDLKWENQINRSTASGIDPANNSNFEQEVSFRLSSYGLGLEAFLSRHISIQGNFEFNRVRFRSEINDSSNRFTLHNDWGIGSTFSIGVNLVSQGIVHVSLRPYIHVSWSGHELNGLDEALNEDAPSAVPLEDDFVNFGLKVIFYNGSWQ